MRRTGDRVAVDSVMVTVGAGVTRIPQPHVMDVVVVEVEGSDRATSANDPAVIEVVDVVVFDALGATSGRVVEQAPGRVVHRVVADRPAGTGVVQALGARIIDRAAAGADELVARSDHVDVLDREVRDRAVVAGIGADPG